MIDALAVLRARLARHKAAGRILQAKECAACVEAILGAARKAAYLADREARGVAPLQRRRQIQREP